MYTPLMRKTIKFLTYPVVAIALLLAFAKPVSNVGVEYDDTQYRCLVSAVYHEARGEPDKGKRAVLDVIFHRSAKTGKSVCEVVAQKQQFPWYKKKGLVALTDESESYYNAAIMHPRVLTDEKYIFFNGVKPPGTACKRIGNHTFCKEKTKQ